MLGLIRCLFFTALIAAGAFSEAYAVVPNRISYQGYLTSPSGTPVNASLPMQFRLFDTPTGGTQAWSESQTVTVTNGVFNVVLGAVAPIFVAFDKQYYLEVQVDTDPPMTPRQVLQSVPYAAAAGISGCGIGDYISCYSGPAGTEGVGQCRTGRRTCNPATLTYGVCTGIVTPSTEISDGIDNDCDGIVDNIAPGSPTLTVSKAGSGTGTVTSSPAGINCGGDCSEAYGAGTPVTLTATPDAGSTFSGWSGGGCTASGTCMVTLSADVTVAATFTASVCDQVLPSNSSNAMQYAAAMELCDTTTVGGSTPGVISATLTLASGSGTPAAQSRAIRPAFGNSGNAQRAGASMIVLSTGAAAASGQINPSFAAFQPGFDTATSSAAPSDWLAANGGTIPTHTGCPGAASTTAYNPVMLTLTIRVPGNAQSFRFSARLFAADYPEYVCSPYNDVFVALLDSTYAGAQANPADKNLARYVSGGTAYPIGVNLAYGNPAYGGTGLFTHCVNGETGCAAGSINGYTNTCVGTSALAGTGMDTSTSTCSVTGVMTGGATGWLTIRGNVVPGEVITLRLALWDVGDGLSDTVVLLDNFAWSPSTTTPGAVLE